MAVEVSYPGVYVEEVPAGVHAISGVATSTTAFIGRTRRGPTDEPVRVQSFSAFERAFGGLWSESTVSYAVAQFFQNGGSDALIVRVASSAAAASVASVKSIKAGRRAAAGAGALPLVAASKGSWGDSLRARLEPVAGDATGTRVNLAVLDTGSGTSEQFLDLSTDPAQPRFVTRVLEQSSGLVRVDGRVPKKLVAGVAVANPKKASILDPALSAKFRDGNDGGAIRDAALSARALEARKKGIWALDKADLFNVLCIPPLKADTDIGRQTRDAAATYCRKRRALFIADPGIAWDSPAKAIAGNTASFMARSSYAALYFPFVTAPDPASRGRIARFAPCGAVAGVFARIDAAHGVWKAPAGREATLAGVSGPTIRLNDRETGQLGAQGINGLRSFPNIGTVVWGARTLDGAEQLASEWAYVPVRRLALFIEESIDRGTRWASFEPNGEALWVQICRSVEAFMENLFRQGAFTGAKPAEAFFVRCDRGTTSQNDIDRGVVTIVVGFAPLKPSEFVVIRIGQFAGKAVP